MAAIAKNTAAERKPATQKPAYDSQAFRNFDQLPDSAKIDVKAVAAVEGCSVATVWRRVSSGLLPAPEKIGGTTRWRVGAIRQSRNGN